MWRIVALCLLCVGWGCSEAPTLPEGSGLWSCQEDKDCKKLGGSAHCDRGLCSFWARREAGGGEAVLEASADKDAEPLVDGTPDSTFPEGAFPEEAIATADAEATQEPQPEADAAAELEPNEQEIEEVEPENPCEGGQSPCADGCVDTQSSTTHCGQCDNACSAVEVCQGGLCVCPNGGRLCDAACVDIQTNAQHCGGCNAVCGAGQQCEGGLCSIPCKAGELRCGAACVDTKKSAQHCGGCQKACRSDQACLNGFCGCEAPKKDCGGVCVNVQADPAHCGDCGKSCRLDGTALCQGGVCVLGCLKPAESCGGTCVDTSSDAKHCGGCGVVCPTGGSCQGGACVCAGGLLLCGSACVDVQTDNAHCGACGTVCGSGAGCVGAVCKCSDAMRTYCGGKCVNVKEDRAHCGACGKSCVAGQACVEGVCRNTPYATTMAGPIPPSTSSPLAYPFAVGYLSQAGLLVADRTKDQILLVVETHLSRQWAGSVGGFQNSPNPLTAKFTDPCGMVEGPNRTVYVADVFNYKIRRVRSSDGVTTFVGSTLGFQEGTGGAAKFDQPRGIVYDAAAKAFYVADFGNRRIRKITEAGVVTTLAGSGRWGSVNGSLTTAEFQQPWGLALDGQGGLYVSDYSAHLIRKIDLKAGMVTTVAGNGIGFKEGPALSAQFRFPLGMAWDGQALYIADRDNHRIRKYDPVTRQVSTLIGKNAGYKNGGTADAQFNQPTGVVWSSDSLYVSDGANRALRRIWMR